MGILCKELSEIKSQEQRHQELYNLIFGWINNADVKGLHHGVELPDVSSNEIVRI